MKFSTVFNFYIIPGVLVFASVVYAESTQGTPGVDYPNYHSIPETSFSCSEQKYIPGFYADLETQCQAFHFCFQDRKESFLCPTGTIFNQAKLACDSWFTSNCSLAPLFFSVNDGPAIETAGRKLPMLMKLNRSPGQSIPLTSVPNIFEKMSSLYDGADFQESSKGLETSSRSGDVNEVSSSNVNYEKSTAASPEESEVTENKSDSLSEETSEIDQNLQQDGAVEEDETYGNSKSLRGELDQEMDAAPRYDPATGVYYVDYNPYQTEWQENSEPVSDEFRSFYDYENRQSFFQDPYQVVYQNVDENDGEVLDGELELDLNRFGQDNTDETDFSRRQLAGSIPKRRRRPPVYFVVEDDEDIKRPSEPEEIYFGDDPGVQSATEATADSTETPDDEKDDVEEIGDEMTEELRQESREWQYTPGPALNSPRPLTTDEFSRLLMAELGNPPAEYDTELVTRIIYQDGEAVTMAPANQEEALGDQSSQRELPEYQGDESGDVKDATLREMYESGSYDFDSEKESSLASEMYGDSVDSDSSEMEEHQASEDPDDTFFVIPEESDEVSVADAEGDEVDSESEEYEYEVAEEPESVSEYEYEVAEEPESVSEEYEYEVAEEPESVSEEYEYEVAEEPESVSEYEYEVAEEPESVSEYAYEVTEQPDIGMKDQEYREYEDVYEYYRSREFPEGYKTYETPKYYDYVGQYRRQYVPEQFYNAEGYNENIDYSNYTPEEARRLAYISALRNRERYAYTGQRYKPGSYMGPVYDSESDHYPEGFAGSHYLEDPQISDYYESDETGYYPQHDSPWIQKDLPQEHELDNQLGHDTLPVNPVDLITDAPLPLDITQADLHETFDLGSEEEDVEDFTDFSSEDGQEIEEESNEQTEDAFYVLDDFDENNEGMINDDSMSDMDNVASESGIDKSYMADYPEQLDEKFFLESENLPVDDSISKEENVTIYKDDPETSKSATNAADSLNVLLNSQGSRAKQLDLSDGGSAFNMKPITDTWSPLPTESPVEKPVTLSSAFERLASMNAANAHKASSANMDFASSPGIMNSVAFSESMDFGPYGYGAGMGQQFNMLNSMQPSKSMEGFSHRTGSSVNGQGRLGKLSSLQEKLRSMKQGKFGVFKRYMKSMNN